MPELYAGDTWGDNDVGQLGNGASVNSSTPTRITIPEDETTSTQTYNAIRITPAEELPLTQTADLTDLTPNTLYNFYVLHSGEAAKMLHPANLLYLTQLVSGADGTASLRYTLPFADKDAVTLAVPAAQTVDGAAISIPDVVFAGGTVSPQVTVAANGATLTEGTDYALSGDLSAEEPGTYLVTVTGIGEYAGEITTSYRVICEHSNSEGVCTICGEIADESLLYGDINLDGRLTIADAVLLVRLLTEDGSAPIDPETLTAPTWTATAC